MKTKRIISLLLSLLMLTGMLSYSGVLAENSADSVSHAYADGICKGIVDKKDTAEVTVGFEIDGKKTVKIVPNPFGENSSTAIFLDAYEVDKKGFDLAKFKYITVEYKYDTASPSYNGKMMLHLLSSKGVLTGRVDVTSVEGISADGWNQAIFEIGSKVEGKLGENSSVGTNLWQFHFFPFGGTHANKLTENDVLYIGNITFSVDADVPEVKVDETKPEQNTTVTTPAVTPSPSGSAQQNAESVSFAYADGICKGAVDRKDNVTVTVGAEYEGKNTVKIVPNPSGTKAGNSISLDAYELTKYGFDLSKFKYISIEYKYDAAIPAYSGKMQLHLLGSKGILKKRIDVSSNESITTGGWNTATFSFGPMLTGNLGDGDTNLWQFHFFPFSGTSASKLTENDVLYIGNITFTSVNPNPDYEYTIEFSTGVSGSSDSTVIKAKSGDVITIPEIKNELEGMEFKGWMPSNDAKTTFMPGDKFTVSESNMVFLPKWEKKIVYPDVVVLDYPNYSGDIIDKNRLTDITLEPSEIVVEDGLNAVKAMPNPAATTGVYFGFDGWKYASANVDTNMYKYAAMLYKFDSAKNHEGFYAQLRPLRGGFKGAGYIPTTEPLKFGEWAIAVFDLTPYAEKIDAENPVLAQMHFLPFQEGKIRELDAGDVFYLSKLLFFKEEPTFLSHHAPFIKGYNDGTFRPNNTMTRAEAVTVATRLVTSESVIKGVYESKFTDVAKGQWYYDNIAYLENRGVLASYSGTFEPSRQITRAEFVEIIYNLGIAKDTGKTVSFTDVPETHPKYKAIMAAASAGIVGGYSDGTFLPDRTITRAQVVKVINNAYGKTLYANEYMSKFDLAPLFKDVTKDHWAYLDVTEASIPHGTMETSEKGEEWFYMTSPEIEMNHAEGAAAVEQTDKLREQRKAEILATPTNVAVIGTKYYVSSTDGDDANDGLSPEKPFKTLAKVNATSLKPGDGVFFKRGDVFRGNLSTKSGATYSAYGEGAKPRLYGSEENGTGKEKWTLVEGTTNVYKYYKQFADIGGIVVDKGDGNGEFILERKIAYLNTSDMTYHNKVDGSDPFDVKSDLDNNTFFPDIRSTTMMVDKGDLYLRSDESNPGELYKSIEFIDGKAHIITALSDVTIDNLCLLYGARHGIGAGTVTNLVITNCEIGWIGGGVHSLSDAGANYKILSRYGNGVEVYGGCDGFVIDNCYVYQCFDAGITNQYQKGGTTSITEKDVVFSNNLIEYCCYNIEYFMGVSDAYSTRLLQNVLYENNILHKAGYGWGRVDPTNSANIKGWDHYNLSDGFIIRNNILDRAYGDLIHVGAQQVNWLPVFEGNTFIQNQGSAFGHFGQVPTTMFKYDSTVGSTITTIVGDESAKIYFLEER